MNRIEKSITVDAPLTSVYDQWTQFEDFPKFMEGIESVQQIDDTHLHWKAQIAGKEKEWDAEIYEQVPNERIAWRSISGAENAGAVFFQPQGDNQTIIRLVLEFQPEELLEKVGTALGIVESRVEGDLERFRTFLQERGAPTGAWRGTV
ncbi:MAG TPA: SRPBCC family protein [Chthoniobacterales bacterium]|jgi:uncharacterized membrane protein